MFKKLAVLSLSLTLFCSLANAVENIQESTISVDYSMTKSTAPDTATIKFYVENSGMNISDIKEKNDKIVNEAMTKIKAVLGEKEQIKTIAYRINNVYSYKDKVRVFQKYEVVNGFEVKLKDMSKIQKVINLATESGVKKVEQLSFSLENGQEECNQLLAETAKGAKERANKIANALGTSLLKVKSVNPYCNINNISQPRYYQNAMKSMAMDSAGAASESAVETIEAGEINLRANVNMTYYLK